MNIEKIKPVDCGHCGNLKVQNVGHRTIEGFYCSDCNHYTKTSKEVFYVKRFKKYGKNTIFESDMILE